MSKASTKKEKIHKDMMIDELIELYPKLTDILMSYGLSCIGCYANAFETLELGLIKHGYSEEQIEDIIDELNEFFKKSPQRKKKKKIPKEADNMKIKVTSFAQKMIKSIAKDEAKDKLPLRVAVKSIGGKLKHSLDFIEKEEVNKTDKVFKISRGTITIVAEKEDYELLNGLEIDYLKEKNREGFKMNNPNAKNT